MRQRSDTQYGQLLMLPEMRFAHAAVSRLRQPDAPLITVYGPSGSGKSHLISSSIREVRRQEPRLTTAQLTAAEFSTSLQRAVKTKAVPEFQESYRGVELFVCEDVQELEGRSQAQSQLLAIIDTVLSESGRVLLSSNKSPGNLSGISARLRSRMVGGVCASIEPFGRASRQMLLLHFAEQRGLSLHDDLAELLAESLALSARELRGVITQLDHLAQQHRRPVDLAIAQAVIQQSCVPGKPTLAQITKVVARAFSVSSGDLRSQCRLKGLVLPRQLAMFAAREWAEKAYSEISRHFNRRSHSTIVHACQRIQQLLDSDAGFSRTVDGIREQLNLPNAVTMHPSTTC